MRYNILATLQNEIEKAQLQNNRELYRLLAQVTSRLKLQVKSGMTQNPTQMETRLHYILNSIENEESFLTHNIGLNIKYIKSLFPYKLAEKAEFLDVIKDWETTRTTMSAKEYLKTVLGHRYSEEVYYECEPLIFASNKED